MAGYNVATRIETLSVRPFEGVSTALSTFVAQNVGAGSVSRVKRGFNAAAVLSFSYTLVMCVTLFYSGNRLLGFFLPADASGVMVSSGGNYLHLMALYLPLSALCGLLQALYRGLNRFRIVLILSVFQIVLRIMLSFRLVPVYGVPAIAHATVIGWILIAIYMGMGAWRYFRATCQE